VVVVAGELPIVDELLAAASDAGWDARRPQERTGMMPWITLDCRAARRRAATPLPTNGPRALLLHDSSLHALEPAAVGFHTLPPLAGSGLVELTTTPLTPWLAVERAEEFWASLGCRSEHVGDGPGLVLGRIVSQLVNEAAFLIGEGNGTPQDVDAGMELGVNHPRGPTAWADAIGLDHVVAVLDALHRELGEERYRVAPLLRRRLAIGGGLR
jgi:3-hydroxybutyryl-CoA dehydrogenase